MRSEFQDVLSYGITIQTGTRDTKTQHFDDITLVICTLRKNENAKKKNKALTVVSALIWNLRQGCILSPCLYNLYAEYIMRNTGLEEAQAGIKIIGRNINNLRYADDTTLMAESKELKSLLWKWKRRVEKLA